MDQIRQYIVPVHLSKSGDNPEQAVELVYKFMKMNLDEARMCVDD
jgi:hypothetical protein